jgi:hypothetical protein
MENDAEKFIDFILFLHISSGSFQKPLHLDFVPTIKNIH